MQPEFMWIDGAESQAASGRVASITNPATSEPLAEVPDASAEDVDRAVKAADRAFRHTTWRTMAPRARAAILFRLASLIRASAEDLARLETANVGKPIREASEEVALAADCFEYYAGAIDKFGGQTVPVSAPGFSMTFREPIGVCALIVPWNFPIAITSWKLAPALAMGNSVVVKPATQTPLTALRIARLAAQAGLPPGVLNIVTGSGSDAGEALVRHPLVRKVGFTGSTEVGSRVMRMAADGIKRVTLELGGKSANIIFGDCDLDLAIPAALSSALGNAGQDCCSRSRLLVEESIYDDFAERLAVRMRAMKAGDPVRQETTLGSLISTAHRDRVISYIEIGKSEGAEILCEGRVPDEEPFRRGAFLEPVLFGRVTPEMRIFREEIFGPVLSLTPFRSEQDAIALANESEYGLSGSIWTRDIGRAIRVARAMETGVVSINSGWSVHLETPFGGVKKSGFGRELGIAALDHYSDWKSVYVQTE